MTRPGTAPNIVALGGMNMALIGTATRLPLPGETLKGERFYTAPGGKGATQAVAAARLGANVRMVGRVGRDLFGPKLLDALKNDGIDVSGVAEDPDHPSGVGMIILDAERQNRVLAIYGANLQCNEDQLAAVEAALDKADVLLLQMEVPFHVSMAAARAARARGVTAMLDPAPASDIPPDAFRDLDIVTPNQTEAEYHTGIRVDDIPSAKAAAEALLERGVATAIVKMAEQGVYWASQEGSGHVPAYDVDVVDTISAGDAFARIHRKTTLGTVLEEARGCSSESGRMVLKQKTARKQGAPSRCCHRTIPTVSASSLTTTAWWPMPACSCRPPLHSTWACGNSSTITST